MTTATRSTRRNGRPARPTLSEQIDRFDHMLDGLGDALQEVIADAVRSAVAGAVQTVLADPTVLRAALARHEPPRPAVWRRVLGGLFATGGRLLRHARVVVRTTRETIASAVGRTANRVRERTTRIVSRLTTTLHLLTLLWQFRRIVGLAVAIGVGTGLAAYLAGPLIASFLSGVGGAAATVLAWPAGLVGRLIVRGGPGHHC